MTQALSERSLLRLPQILGDRRKGIAPLVPVSRSTWWAGIKTGRFPKPLKLGSRITVWRSEDILRLLDKISNAKK